MKAPDTILPLELRNVSFEVGGTTLIRNISCRFEAGLRTCIVGPNGAGKSLLLRLCHGLITPTHGDIQWHGFTNGDVRARQAMVFQRPVMLRRTVNANVDYALKIRGITPSKRRARVAEVLERTGLAHLSKRPARVLSVGEQQRLALARVWALKPQILFLDEPTASLDPAGTHAVEGLIDAIHQDGARIVMTTHDLGQARRIADDVLFMHRGEVRAFEAAESFFDHPTDPLAAAFIRGELLWWDQNTQP